MIDLADTSRRTLSIKDTHTSISGRLLGRLILDSSAIPLTRGNDGGIITLGRTAPSIATPWITGVPSRATPSSSSWI